jgi:hypothetical protein
MPAVSITRLAVTTVVRSAEASEPSSFLSIVDLGQQRVLSTAAVPESPHRIGDPNPRGGLRGARGIGVFGDRLALVSSDALFVLDASWNLIRHVSHPWMGGLHGIMVEADAIWVTSTSADLLLRFDWDGEITDAWCWREDEALVQTLGFGLLPRFDEGRDYRIPAPGTAAADLVHLNGLSRGEAGLLLSFGQVLTPESFRREVAKSVIARTAAHLPMARTALSNARRRRNEERVADPTPAPRKAGSYVVVELADTSGGLRQRATGRVVYRKDGTRVPNHDIKERGGLLIFCDSNESKLVAHDRTTGARRQEVAIPGMPAFARGLVPLGGDRFAVGSQQPAAIHVANLSTGEIEASVPLADLPGETVFGIAVLSDDFAAPPTDRELKRSLSGRVAS